MLESPAIVVALEDQAALVEADYGGGCGSGMCSKGGCGTAVLGQLFSRNPRGPMRVMNPIQARQGERVIMGLEEGSLLRSAVLAYLFPLLLLFAGALAARFFFHGSDGAAVAGAVMGLALGWGSARILGRRWLQTSRPVILRRA